MEKSKKNINYLRTTFISDSISVVNCALSFVFDFVCEDFKFFIWFLVLRSAELPFNKCGIGGGGGGGIGCVIWTSFVAINDCWFDLRKSITFWNVSFRSTIVSHICSDMPYDIAPFSPNACSPHWKQAQKYEFMTMIGIFCSFLLYFVSVPISAYLCIVRMCSPKDQNWLIQNVLSQIMHKNS